LDAATVWTKVHGQITDELGWLRTRGWLDELSLRSLERGVATLESGSPEVREQATPHVPAIRRALVEVLGSPVRVRLALRVRKARRARPRATPEPAVVYGEGVPDVELETERTNARHQLSSFLAGPTNEIPLRFALQAVEEPGSWNPLVFYGSPGSGKTHLLHGIVNSYRRRYPTRKVVYTSSARFSRQYSMTARKRASGRFREFYRRADLLVLDDLQDLAGKQGTERELTLTLDHLHAHGAQVVCAASSSPKRLNHLDALEGRLLGGVVVPLKAPDRETRLAVVRARCAKGFLHLEPAAVEILLGGFNSVRELLTALTRLEAYGRHVNDRLDAPTVRQILADMLGQDLRPATLELIAGFVSERLGCSLEQLKGRSRKGGVVRARRLSMGLSRALTTLTLREVGVYFGGRSCASVHFAEKRAFELQTSDPDARELWEAARTAFTPRPGARGIPE
jgi:chromosomal replication initiator protein